MITPSFSSKSVLSVTLSSQSSVKIKLIADKADQWFKLTWNYTAIDWKSYFKAIIVNENDAQSLKWSVFMDSSYR